MLVAAVMGWDSVPETAVCVQLIYFYMLLVTHHVCRPVLDMLFVLCTLISITTRVLF